MNELVLYGSSTSPFVRKVHVALMVKGLRHRFELAPPWSPTAGVERLNPLHKVPVLELGDGRRLFDSRVIVQYLDVLQPAPPLLPTDPAQKIAVLQVEALADGVAEAVALHTQEGWRQPASRSAFWLDRQRQKVVAGIAALETEMEPWMPAAGPLQLPAIAAGAALGFTAFWLPHLEWRATAPRLAVLVERLDRVDAWRQTRPYLAAGAKFPVL
ncbi:MAG: glutathione S-transferase N-terminal domain-containing protein [Chitinophagaceae bacterium]|nr:glutathione S-transferase N-terminal domain-containing protein [Rubrivivax sp.]